MGLPQVSFIAPFLFNILLYDLPTKLSKDVVVLQCADDICIWMNVTIKHATTKKMINYTRKVYQKDLDNLHKYIFENGLTLSTEKTHIMLLDNGSDPDTLQQFTIGREPIQYKNMVKFLGIQLTSKLTWNAHIGYILTKARKCINFLKMVSRQSRGQDIFTLKRLSKSLVRSKLPYGQEVFFSAPNYLLKKLQSIDCKAYKLALGVPFHASTIGTYKETGELPLAEYRQLSCAKYVLRGTNDENFVCSELKVQAETNFPKRAKQISCLMPIGTYVSDLFQKSKLNQYD